MASFYNKWIAYALTTTVFWGIWGAFIEIPEKAGFPATMGYVMWSISMIPCAIYAMNKVRWLLQYDMKSVGLGLAVGLSGAGGQLLLFQALREGPAYIVFPLISLFPICTIFLSFLFLREKANVKQWIGIVLALVAIFFLSYQPAPGDNGASAFNWLYLSLLVFVLWGIQGFVMKFSNNSMNAESIFFYMMVTGIMLAPVALLMTDFSQPIHTGFKGPYLAFGIHLLNSIGALSLVYALRYGKAIVVVPMTGLSPIITVVISLILYGVVPSVGIMVGVGIAMVAIYLLSE
jgi:uncharacterized membrane protein